MSEKKWREVFREVPGAWTGNRPEGYGEGHVTVDPTCVVQALAYLRRRHISVVRTRIPSGMTDGLQLVIRDHSEAQR